MTPLSFYTLKGSVVNILRWTSLLGWFGICLLAGCAGPVTLQCRFDPNEPLTYRFTSSRQIDIHWGTESKNGDPNQTSTITESLTYVMTYTVEDANDGGMTRLKATCREAQVRRSNSVGRRKAIRRDAAESLAGKSFHLVFDDRGCLVDAEELRDLLKTLAEKAFREEGDGGRVKDPEMINDITATQWFLFDAISSRARQPLQTGRTWTSQQLIPTPMVMRQARDITYTLGSSQYTDEGRLVEISSSSTLSEQESPHSWPIPYSGTFQVAGTFGFLQGYRPVSLTGTGMDRFNLDTGVLTSSEHTFEWEVAVRALPLVTVQANPYLVIKQTLKMEQL